MRLLVGSDLHLEFPQHPRPPVPDESEFDLVILAGDISMGVEGVTWAKRKFPNHEILYLSGNHEFYKRDYWYLQEQFNTYCDGHIHILNPGSFQFKNVQFIGATLWSNLTYQGKSSDESFDRLIERSISDFGLITDSKAPRINQFINQFPPFSVNRMREIHEEEKAFIQNELSYFSEEAWMKKIVLTHFLPSAQCTAPQFENSFMNPYFASDCDDIMINNKIDLWIFGHTHCPMDFKHDPSGTRLFCNPMGYPGERYNPKWKIIEV